jgi:hypothetical protein
MIILQKWHARTPRRVISAISGRNASSGLCELLRKNYRNKSHKCVTNHHIAGRVIQTKHGMSADSSDIVTCAMFSLHQFDGLGSLG